MLGRLIAMSRVSSGDRSMGGNYQWPTLTPISSMKLQSDLRAVKEGWYAIDERGNLLSGPFSNRETCLSRISQSVNWSSARELSLQRPYITGVVLPVDGGRTV